jgi:hypothetical protein
MALFDNNPLQSLYAPVKSGIGNLFEGMTPFGSSIPSGILDPAQEEKLRNQALFQGLLGTAATYLATPKTLGAGSPLPYIGKAVLGGMGASQDVIDRAIRAKLLSGRDDNLYNVDGALVDKAGKVIYQSPTKQQKRDTAVVDGVVVDVNTGEPIYTSPKQQKLNTEIIDVGGKKILINKDTGAPIQEYKITGGGLGLKDIYGEPQKDVNGKLVYIPKIPGYPVRDMSGNIIQGDVNLPEKDAKPPTEEQSKARTFFKRMEGATKVFNKPALDAKGKPILDVNGNPLTIEQVAGKPEIGAEIAGALPIIGGVAKRSTESPNRQLYRQAQENWVTANLRKESGAVIGVEEMQNEINKYFPQIGEGPEVIAQKAEARRIAEEGMKSNANFPVERKTEEKAPAQQKRVVRTGKDKSGRTVFQYSDGSIGYGN